MNSLGHMEELEDDNGMDLRDYFAAKTISSLGWAGSFSNKWSKIDDSVYAQRAYEIADAMMKARKK